MIGNGWTGLFLHCRMGGCIWFGCAHSAELNWMDGGLSIDYTVWNIECMHDLNNVGVLVIAIRFFFTILLG